MRFLIFLLNILPLALCYKTCNVLTLGGGGSFGAVEVGILKDMLDKNIITGEFDVIAGISAGGLNAAYLSYGENIKDNINSLEDLYTKFTTKNVYKSNCLFRVLKDWSIFNSKPLEDTIKKILKNKEYNKNNPITLIGSTNLNTQKLDIFRYDKLSKRDQVDVLMATSAIPILFKPRKINNCLYVDGGTIENEILYQVLDAYPADYYNFTFVCATNKEHLNMKISNIKEYLKSISGLIVNNYVYDIAKIKNSYFECKKGKINICYPTDPELMKYSFLDFDKGNEIINIAKKNYKIETINFC